MAIDNKDKKILNVPHLRFPEFSGEWKNIKLCEVLSERKEKNVEQNLRICSVAVQKGVVDQVEHLGRSYAANDTSNYSVAHYGDIIYTKSPTGDFLYGIVKQNLLQETVAVSPLYGVFTPLTFDLGYFLHTYFQSAICARNYLLPIVQKGAKNTINITNDTFISSKLYLPLDVEEQKAIADTFVAADREIELLRQDIRQEKQKKKALMQQQLGGFFRTELTKAFGPEPEPATLPIDWAYLEAAKLSVVSFTECTVTDFHEGEHKGLRFSAANVELRRTVEEKSGPTNDNWMTRTETLFRGIVVRCKDICDPTLDIALNDMFQERKKDDITDPAAFRKYFAAHTADGREADDQVTPQLRGLVQKLEASSRTSKLCGLILRDGDLALALNTRYVFAGIPEELDLRDIDGIRKWFIASLTGMGNLLDLITESPALTGAAE